MLSNKIFNLYSVDEIHKTSEYIFLKHKFYCLNVNCLNVNSIRAQMKIIQTEVALELNYSKQRFYLNPRTIKLTINTEVVLVLAFGGFNPPERNKKHVSQSQLQ